VQKTFHAQVNNLCDVVRRTGNPFFDDFPELITIDSRDCADVCVVESIMKVYQLGNQQYQKYCTEVIETRSKSMDDTIKKNSLPLFRKNLKKETSKQGKKIAVLKSNLNLFAQLYVALQNREGSPVLSTRHIRVWQPAPSNCQVRSLKVFAPKGTRT
jgi:hypothetical protein